MGVCPKKGIMGEDESVTLQKRLITIIIDHFWLLSLKCSTHVGMPARHLKNVSKTSHLKLTIIIDHQC